MKTITLCALFFGIISCNATVKVEAQDFHVSVPESGVLMYATGNTERGVMFEEDGVSGSNMTLNGIITTAVSVEVCESECVDVWILVAYTPEGTVWCRYVLPAGSDMPGLDINERDCHISL